MSDDVKPIKQLPECRHMAAEENYDAHGYDCWQCTVVALRAENKALREALTWIAGYHHTNPAVADARDALDEYPQREDDDK